MFLLQYLCNSFLVLDQDKIHYAAMLFSSAKPVIVIVEDFNEEDDINHSLVKNVPDYLSFCSMLV